MLAKADATAQVSAEKRRLSTAYDDTYDDNTKRVCLPSLPQPDAAEAPSYPLTEWWNAALDVPNPCDGTLPWDYCSPCPFDGQYDTAFPIADLTGCDNEVKMELDGDGLMTDPVDWGDCAWSSGMDIFSESKDFATDANTNDTEKKDTSEHIQIIEPKAHYDTCFGVIHTSVTTSVTRKQDTTPVPVSITPTGNFVKLYFQDSNQYAGIVTIAALSRLLMEFTTKLKATLGMKRAPRTTTSGKKDEDIKYRPKSESSLRIVVYGTMKESSKIGKLLSDADLYLQHPVADECDVDIEYFNPHYLVRPGSRMPRLEELEIPSNDAVETSAGTLDEMSKSRFMKIFDSADDDGITPTTVPSPRLRSSLKQHQLTALAMMSERECGLIEKPQFPCIWEKSNLSDGTSTYRHRITGRTDCRPFVARGGILADEMGLGKTLSLLSLVCWSIDLLSNGQVAEVNEESLATLIVTPKSTIPGWEEQIRRHISPDQIRVVTYHGSDRQAVASRFRNNDIVLTTYETLRSEFPKKGPLYAENWFRVVLDEAHHIGNRSTMKFKAACGIQARRRWCLTGTPIHNSLDNYGALLSFIGVAQFAEKSQFDLWIANPIKEKRPDGWNKLQFLVRTTCLRRTKQAADQSLELPTRNERIESVHLHQSERELYEFFRQRTTTIAARFWQRDSTNSPVTQQKDTNMLSLINILRLICNHENLLPNTAMTAWRAKRSDAVDWRLFEASKKTCVLCDVGLEESSEQSPESTMGCGHFICSTCSLERDDGGAELFDSCPGCSTGAKIGADIITSCPSVVSNPSSSKIEALLRNIYLEQATNREKEAKRPIKSVVFSYWTKMLDLAQEALHSNGYVCQRIDGKMSLRNRSDAICQFAEDPGCTVMLATISSAGEGIDLTAASFVHLIEPHWNPMMEAQAIARVHRIGQLRPVIATKYVTQNSVEEYVRWVQEDKLRLIARSLNSDDICQREVDGERWKKLKLFLGEQDNC